MAVAAQRMDVELSPGYRAIIAIPHDVLGASRTDFGPYWVLDPRPALQRLFWEKCGHEIAATDIVSVAEGVAPAGTLRDAGGESVPGLDNVPPETALFFVDREPAANWGHPCTYYLVSATGAVLKADHDFPPAGSMRLVGLVRR